MNDNAQAKIQRIIKKAEKEGLARVHVPVELLKAQQAEIKRLKEQAPKKGHWEMEEDQYGIFDEIPVCSECGCTNAMRKKTTYCEHCGADMREGDGE